MCTGTNQTNSVTLHGSKVAVGISRYLGQRINWGQAGIEGVEIDPDKVRKDLEDNCCTSW